MRVVLWIFCFCFFGVCHAQEKMFFSIDNEILKDADTVKSFYYEIFTEKKSRVPSDKDLTATKTTITYYTRTNTVYFNEVIKDSAETSRTYYYPSGKIKLSGAFNGSRPIGTIISHFENGSINSELVFENDEPGRETEPVIGIIHYTDSTGKVLVDNGNGMCNCDLSPHEASTLLEKGTVQDGMKTGQWTGVVSDSSSFVENYKDGELVKGLLKADGVEYTYTKVVVAPRYPGGSKQMYDVFLKNMRYPASALRGGVQGGVYTSFVIDTEGNIIDIKTLKGLSKDIDEEAIRVIKLLSPWSPGTLRGKPRKVKFTVPMKFKLH